MSKTNENIRDVLTESKINGNIMLYGHLVEHVSVGRYSVYQYLLVTLHISQR